MADSQAEEGAPGEKVFGRRISGFHGLWDGQVG